MDILRILVVFLARIAATAACGVFLVQQYLAPPNVFSSFEFAMASGMVAIMLGAFNDDG